MVKKFLNNSAKLAKNYFSYLVQGWNSGLFFPYLKVSANLLIEKLNHFHQALLEIKKSPLHSEDEKILKLKNTTAGLYALLPTNPLLTYSIVIYVNQPNSKFFEACLRSAVNQSVQNFEILIGLHGEPSKEIKQLLKKYKVLFPQIREFNFSNDIDKNVILNSLVQESKKSYFFILEQEDWIRPDTLYRFDQTLRLLKKPEISILYCDQNKISTKNYFLPLSHSEKGHFHFPYFFEHVESEGFLFASSLWRKVGGFRDKFRGSAIEDVLLRLDLHGAHFQHVPLTLYSKRNPSKNSESKSIQCLMDSLKEYTSLKGLNWTFTNGFRESDIQAQPTPNLDHCVHIIIPFKDQKELTLKCVHSVLTQQKVNFKITAIDNNSIDSLIGEELRRLGCEVLQIDEPFNYSRLNNTAVKQSKFADTCDILFFLNNDVKLEPNTLFEMLRWIDQPNVGMVGCRLHYPNGTLQHGGIELKKQANANMIWKHNENGMLFHDLDVSKKIKIVDCVTAACAIIKKKDFLSVGGFDEIWYPIGYSDTNLAVKLKNHNLLCLYTPYAAAIHYESITRKESIEDYERSWWLHEQTRTRGLTRTDTD